MNNSKNNEIRQLFALIIFSAFVVYFLPQQVGLIFFTSLLFVFWRTKKDYFWLAFIFILIEAPGGLFAGREEVGIQRLPVYSLGKGFSFNFIEIFLMIYLFKTIINKKNRNYNPFYRNGIIALFFLLIVLIVFSLGTGVSVKNFVSTMRLLFSLTLFYCIYFSFKDTDSFSKLFKLLFPFVFIALFFQAYSLTMKSQFIHLFIPDLTAINGRFNESGKFGSERPIETSYLVYLCLIVSLFYLKIKKHDFSQNYLISIILVALLSFFLTGSRGWLLGISTVMILYLVASIKNNPKLVKYFVAGTIFLIIGILFIPVIRNQVTNAFSRYETLSLLAKGDITGGGTISRIDKRAPKVMKAFSESSIVLGSGFTDEYFKHWDGHVGYHNLLLNTGVIGFALFSFVLINILLKIKNLQKRLIKLNYQAKGLSVFNMGLIGLMVLNAAAQTIGFTPGSPFQAAFIISIILNIPDVIMKESLRIEKTRIIS